MILIDELFPRFTRQDPKLIHGWWSVVLLAVSRYACADGYVMASWLRREKDGGNWWMCGV